jgi:hypothetical protein
MWSLTRKRPKNDRNKETVGNGVKMTVVTVLKYWRENRDVVRRECKIKKIK